MEPIIVMLGWIGVSAPVALGAIGSVVCCTRAGQAAVGALLETESAHGRYIGVSAMPSSQTIYGIVGMLALNRPLDTANAPGVLAIVTLVGLALMLGAFGEGSACDSAFNVAKDKPEVCGLSLAAAAVVECFAVLAVVFALVLAGSLLAVGG